MEFSIMVAVDKNLGIGINNDLPWHLPTDFKYFKTITVATKSPETKNAVIMGRKTWESIPIKRRPLPNRLNVILSRNPKYNPKGGTLLASSFDNALALIKNVENINEIFVIGGGRVFTETIKHPSCKRLYITEIDKEYNCDAFFPEIPEDFKKISESEPITENGATFRFVIYEKDTNSK